METTGSGSSSTMPNGVPFTYVEGQWTHVANRERDLCKRANPDDWRLASFGGASIEHDARGRPTGYLGSALTWEGDSLTSFGSTSFYYDGLGRRAFKSQTRHIHDSSGRVLAVPLSVTITGSEVLAGVAGLGLAGGSIMFSKHNPGMSSRSPRSWLTQEEGIEAMRKFGGDASKAAEYLMNKRGGLRHRGAGTDYNMIKKWLDRVMRHMM